MMVSVTNVEIGKIEESCEVISIPMWLKVSTDDDPDSDIPQLGNMTMGLYFTHSQLVGEREEVHDRVVKFLHNYRFHFTGDGFNRLENALKAYLSKQDLSAYGKLYIPEPASPTRH